MATVPAPEAPQYRVTLFFGPEPIREHPSRLNCVFNVKKRSWKGGVQIAVEVEEAQLADARHAVEFEDWLRRELSALAPADRVDYESRARDLFVQGVCALKLDLALEAGLPQKNGSVDVNSFSGELQRAVREQAHRLRSRIRDELDLG